MADWIKDTLPGLGLDFDSRPVRVINRNVAGQARLRGAVMQFDTFRTSPATTNARIGSPNSCYTNVVDPDFRDVGNIGGQCFCLYCVLTENVGPGMECMAMLWSGSIELFATQDLVVAGDAGAVNENLFPALEFSSGVVVPNAASKMLAIAQEGKPDTTPNPGLIHCLFNGIHFWAKL